MKGWRTLALADLVGWLQGKTYATEIKEWNSFDGETVTRFTDGSAMRFTVEYEGDYSEYTAGEGLGELEISVRDA